MLYFKSVHNYNLNTGIPPPIASRLPRTLKGFLNVTFKE